MFRFARFSGVALIALVALFCFSSVSAKYVLLHQKNGPAGGNQMGFSVANAGDVNSDGHADFIVGAPFADPGSPARTDAGSVFVYSGKDGSLIYQKDGAAAGDRFGWAVANAGDVNFDLIHDFIVGAPFRDVSGFIDAGSAFVYSGVDGTLLLQKDGFYPGIKLGWSVAGVGDINQDFKSDVIVGAPFDSSFGIINRGYYAVLSGANGAVLNAQEGLAAGDLMGLSVGGGGDVNGDGRPDYLVGVPSADDLTFGRPNAGYVDVYSGASYGLIYRKYGSATNDSLGYSVAITGDVNIDGKADFIVGAPTADPGGLGNAGSAYVYSGATGTVLFQKNGSAGGYRLGNSVARAGDVNSDGKNDFIIGAPLASAGGISFAGSAFVYSGANGGLLFQKDGSAFNDQLGYSVGGGGDFNSSAQADFIIGAPLANSAGTDAGSAFVYTDDISSPLPLVLLFQKNGASVNSTFGHSVAGVGDVNGDNYADFIIGAPYSMNTPNGVISSAYVYSGATGALVYQKDGGTVSDQFGRFVAGSGDVNGDGKTDFIIDAPRANPSGLSAAGTAYIYSGSNGSLLYQKDGAFQVGQMGPVAGIGDVNGDGKGDFIIGNTGASPGGRFFAGSAYVYSGATGSLIYQKEGANTDDGLGTVAAAGDVNGDGTADFIIGAHGVDFGGLFNFGAAYVYSGATGALLFQKNGAVPLDNFGYSVAGAGDVNGDGKADVIVGTPFASLDGFSAVGLGFGSAYVYSGVDGSLLFQKNGVAYGDNFGASVAGAGDLNGDGKSDFVVGAYSSDLGFSNAGAVFVFSGATGNLLFRKNGVEANGSLGGSAGVNDVNGDGKPDIIFGAAGIDAGGISNSGTAYVYGFPCPYAKGDMDGNGFLDPSDYIVMQNCVFYGIGDCKLCFSDVNCDGLLDATDLVLLLNAIFLGDPFPC